MKLSFSIDLNRLKEGIQLILVSVGLAAIISLIIVGISKAQTPAPHPDVPLDKAGATYPFTCQPVEPVDKMIQLCAVRTDLTAPVELGCVDHTTISSVTWEVTVERTPHQDGMIRCYATDSEGNVSDISDNAGVADFTPPGRPFVK